MKDRFVKFESQKKRADGGPSLCGIPKIQFWEFIHS